MEIHGGIDNALRHGSDYKDTVFHLVFTGSSVYALKVLDRKEEKENLDLDSIRAELTPGSSSNALQSRIQMRLVSRALEEGKAAEQDFHEFVENNPQKVEKIDYSRIVSVEFSRGSLFSLPYLRLVMGNTDRKYDLVRDNFDKAGKLKVEVFQEYLSVLKNALGSKISVRQ